VVAIHPERLEVVIGTADELAGHHVVLEEVNWLAGPLEEGASCEVQIRYRAAGVPAKVLSAGGETVSLGLERPVRAISPGQSGVLYGPDGQVLGGGVIA
jgi:tRNA-specific 2-thiouridylase